MTNIVSSRTRRHFLSASAMLFVLSGCGNLIGPSIPPGKIYVLQPVLPTPSAMPESSWQLSVARPEASASLATDRIVLIRNDTLDYYADAQWTDSLPQLVQNALVGALEASSVFRTAGPDVESTHTDYVLQPEIKAFEARYTQENGPPAVVVDIIVKLIAARSGLIIAQREFHYEQSASANSVPAVVTAFDAAVSAVLADIVNWVDQTGPANSATTGAGNG